MKPTEIKFGMVVQLNPDTVKNPMFAGCMMTITEPRTWGAQGYVQALGENNEPGGRAYYRATWEEMELVGMANWIADSQLHPGSAEFAILTVDFTRGRKAE